MEDFSKHIIEAKDGHQKAFHTLLENHWDYVYNYIFNQTSDTYISEEICIQTFARAFDKIDQFDDKYSFKTWLITICKRLWIDNQRKKEVKTTKIDKQVSAIKSEATSIEDDMIHKQYIKSVKIAIENLKPDDKKVLQKRLFEDKSYAEIASEMDESINAIKVKILRAKRKLIKSLPNQNT